MVAQYTATAGAVIAELAKRFEEVLPTNWQGLDEGEFDRVIELARDGTLALVWVPEIGVVRALVAAGEVRAREQALVNARGTILSNVAAVLDEGRTSGALVPELRRFVGEALAAATAGMDLAAQTLLAVALSRLLHGGLGFKRLGAAFNAWEHQDPEDALIGELRLTSIQRATVRALLNTDASLGGFNRHGTLHGTPAFLNEPAMLAGFL
jgi:hypothetical protein